MDNLWGMGQSTGTFGNWQFGQSASPGLTPGFSDAAHSTLPQLQDATFQNALSNNRYLNPDHSGMDSFGRSTLGADQSFGLPGTFDPSVDTATDASPANPFVTGSQSFAAGDSASGGSSRHMAFYEQYLERQREATEGMSEEERAEYFREQWGDTLQNFVYGGDDVMSFFNKWVDRAEKLQVDVTPVQDTNMIDYQE